MAHSYILAFTPQSSYFTFSILTHSTIFTTSLSLDCGLHIHNRLSQHSSAVCLHVTTHSTPYSLVFITLLTLFYSRVDQSSVSLTLLSHTLSLNSTSQFRTQPISIFTIDNSFSHAPYSNYVSYSVAQFLLTPFSAHNTSSFLTHTHTRNHFLNPPLSQLQTIVIQTRKQSHYLQQ